MQAAQRKLDKYREPLPNILYFKPIAVQNFGALNSSAVDFINTLDDAFRLSQEKTKNLPSFFNAFLSPSNASTVLCCSSLFPMTTTTISFHAILFLTFVFSPWDFYSLWH